MKKLLLCVFTLSALLGAGFVSASGNGHHLDAANIDPTDKASLKRGAQFFVSYCFSCHQLAYMRYSRIAHDIEISESEVSDKFIYTGAKVGDTMQNAMRPVDAKRWFGTEPPDLSVVTRSRSVDWVYTYLRSFYRDDTKPWGVNNTLFKDVAMPHVLWELQGLQEPVMEKAKNEQGYEVTVQKGLKLVEKGKQTPEEFDNTVRDIVNFLNYVGEPTKLERISTGKWVIGFLLVFFVIVFLLKKEYWKDVH